MLEQLQLLVDAFKSDEDLKHLEIEVDETCASVEVVGGLRRYYEIFELSYDSRSKRYDLLINKPFNRGETMTSVSIQRLLNHDVEFCIYPDRIVFYMVDLEFDKMIEILKFLLVAVDA